MKQRQQRKRSLVTQITTNHDITQIIFICIFEVRMLHYFCDKRLLLMIPVHVKAPIT